MFKSNKIVIDTITNQISSSFSVRFTITSNLVCRYYKLNHLNTLTYIVFFSSGNMKLVTNLYLH